MRSSGLRLTGFTSILLTLFVWTSSASAQQNLWIHDSNGRLGTVDVLTGDVSIVGDMGVTMTDIAFAPDGTTLYGVSYDYLYEIDPVTAAVVNIGPHAIPIANALVFDKDGTLYAAGQSSTSLFEINLTNGRGSTIGNIGFASAGDLAFNGGELYLSSTTDELIQIDLDNGGMGTAIGAFGFRSVYGLATAENGVLYGVAGTEVFSVNTLTGAGTLVFNYFGNGIGDSYGSSFTTDASVRLGDVNLDGAVDFLDINPFIAVLSSAGFQAEADCDGNGVVDFLDIMALVAILSDS